MVRQTKSESNGFILKIINTDQSNVFAFDNLSIVEFSASAIDKVASNRSFPWKNVIKACLRSSDDNQLPIKRLRKKVVASSNRSSSV